MISKTDLRVLNLMIEKTNRLIDICDKYNDDEIKNSFIISDSIQYEFEKLYEDSTRLSAELRINYPELHINDLRSIRNRVAHAYESVSITILLDTVRKDIPSLKAVLKDFVERADNESK